MGTVFLYLDYTMPLAPLREELTRLLESNPLWDKRINVLQVTNASEKTIEVRALMSATSSGNAFDLRCNVREGLVKYVQEHFPACLPLTRAVVGAQERKDYLQEGARDGRERLELGKKEPNGNTGPTTGAT